VATTLVISDLHLGNRRRLSVLTRRPALERLLDALDGCERLVLLGDVVELLEVPVADGMAVAEPVLRAIGARLGREREVVLVPGNHDRIVIAPWLRAHGPELRPETAVPPDASPLLARIAGWLAPARVSVRYPGVWLPERVWATHGHYLDLHLFPVGAWGVARGVLHPLPRAGATPNDYERARRPQLSPLLRRFPRPLAALAEYLAELGRAATMPRLRRRVLHPRIAPLTATVLSVQMRRHALPSLARVVSLLSIEADAVIFGHVHRLGPLADDDPEQWRSPGGGPRLLNSGSWLYEPLLVHHAAPPHPYWPGGAIALEDGRALPIGLLDDLRAADLR
jgi:Calcineurin-like phosphoesterase